MTRFWTARLCRPAPAFAIFRPSPADPGKPQRKRHPMDTIDHNQIDPAKLDQLMGRVINDISAGYGGVMISLGHKLGLYKAMAGAGPLSAREVAAAARLCARREAPLLKAARGPGFSIAVLEAALAEADEIH